MMLLFNLESPSAPATALLWLVYQRLCPSASLRL